MCEICVLNSIQDIKRMGREKACLTFVHLLLTAGLCPYFLTYILINSQSTLNGNYYTLHPITIIKHKLMECLSFLGSESKVSAKPRKDILASP